MGKQCVRLRLKDMYAIKHALQDQIVYKTEKLQCLKYNCEDRNKNEVAELKKIVIRLEKDIDHETWLLQTMCNEIEEFRKVINHTGGY